jgi:SEC-C motif-containing protein
MTDICPCGSGKNYSDCCQPLHQGAAAPSAEALMRSRYSAYARGLVEYIIKTTHPENHDAARSLEERRKEIELFCKNTVFKGLKILEAIETVVKFTAYLSQEGKEISFTEKSTFEKVLGRWLYLKGELDDRL